jgi:hypothetical protein
MRSTTKPDTHFKSGYWFRKCVDADNVSNEMVCQCGESVFTKNRKVVESVSIEKVSVRLQNKCVKYCVHR